MKKVITFSFILLIISAMIFPAGLNVTSPKANSSWNAGQKLIITWTTKKFNSSVVKINIFKNSIIAANFVKQLKGTNTGRYLWNIPSDFPQGDYILRVKCDANKTSGDSRQFNIKGTGHNPPDKVMSLTVRYPNGGETLSRNYPKAITWKAENPTGKIIIELWKGNRKYGTIANNIPAAQGTYNWTIGNTFGNPQAPGGDDYRIKVSGSSVEDISDKYFTISDMPGIVNNRNNIGNTIHTFQNTPKKFSEIAIPPTIEKITILSTNPQYRGQVVKGNVFNLNVTLKNRTKKIMKTDWVMQVSFNKNKLLSIILNNLKQPRKPGEEWIASVRNIDTTYSFIPNKTSANILTITIGSNSKSTMIGIVERTNEHIIPKINEFKIWNAQCTCWSNSGKHKPGNQFEIKYNVEGAVKAEIKNMSNNKILKSFTIKDAPWDKHSIDKLLLTADITGTLKLMVYSKSNNFASAEVKLNASAPLHIGDKYLSFDIWRSQGIVRTKGLVQGYRTITLVERIGKVHEKQIKKLTATEFKSAKLDWQFQAPSALPAEYTLTVTFLDYSTQKIIRTK